MLEEERGQLIKAFIDIRRSMVRLAGQGELTQGEYLVLRRIKLEHESDQPLALRISQYLSMPPPAVSRIFNSLEGRGFIERSINHDNRRCVNVALTESGAAVLLRAEKKVQAVINRLVGTLGEEDAATLLALLKRVADYFSVEEGERNGG